MDAEKIQADIDAFLTYMNDDTNHIDVSCYGLLLTI